MSIDIVQRYAERGWAVFPLLPRSKVPATPHGFHDASHEIDKLLPLWGARTNLNVGLATGEKSNCWILDVDYGKGGPEFLEALTDKYGSLPDTLVSKTGGGGRHYFFKIPKGITIPSNSNKIGPGIDLRGTGGYACIPPSVHPNGSLYEWEDESVPISDPPKWLVRMITELKKIPISPPAYDGTNSYTPAPDGDWTADDIISMLDCVDADDRGTWISIGMALHSGGWPYSIWDNWSRKSSKYGGTAMAWRGFKSGGGVTIGTLVHLAQSGGWSPKERPYEALDLTNVNGVDLSQFMKKPMPKIEIDERPTIGGLIGDTLSWINSTAFKLQPELGTMNIIAALGSVFGRRYALQKLDTRTNIYMVGIAETGQGKDNSRKCIKKLMGLSGLDNFCGPDEIRTGPGLFIELKQRPSLLVNLDEVGMFMKAMFDPKAPAYIREISSAMTKLYSSSNSSYIGGKLASSPDERTSLQEPNLCIYGTTTLSSYADAMKKSAIDSGELNRFIVIKSSIDFPPANHGANSAPPPESLVSRWSQFAVDGLAAAPDIIEQEKTAVLLGDMGKEVERLQDEQDDRIREYHSAGLGALWGRYRENVLKVAMIVAIARDHKNPVLIATDIDFGKALVGNSVRFMMSFAKDEMYDNDFQRSCSSFIKAVKGGCSTRTAVNLKLRIEPKRMDIIEKALEELGSIVVYKSGKTTKYTLKE